MDLWADELKVSRNVGKFRKYKDQSTVNVKAVILPHAG